MRLNVERFLALAAECGASGVREIARLLGLDHGYVSRVLRGEQEPGRKFIYATLTNLPGAMYHEIFVSSDRCPEPPTADQAPTVGEVAR